MKHIWNLLLGAGALLLVVLLPACGGGGGDSPAPALPQPVVTGNVFAPATGPGDVEAYFPNAVGNQWTLDYTATEDAMPTVTGRLTVSVTGTKSVMGVNATILSQVDSGGGIGSGENYYHVSPGGITYVGNNDSADLLTSWIVPYAQLRFPVGTGAVSSLTGTNLPLGSDSLGNPLTLDMAQQIVNTGFEDINVVAGAFVGALKQTTTITGTIKDPLVNLTFPLSGTEVRWWVPHVGIVKQTTSVTVDTQTATSSAELRGYVVNGVRRGLGSEFTAVDGLSPGDGNSSPPIGRPVVATDGTNFLVVARRANGTGTFGSYTTEWLATPVQIDGTVGASTSISTPTPTSALVAERTAVAFDGTTYLVVYERDNNFAATGNHPSLVAQRVTPAGAIVGSASEVAPPGTRSPVLAFDGTNYLLVFIGANGGLEQVKGVFISPLTGQTTGAEFPITAAPGYQFDPAVAFDGTNYLVAWDQGVWAPQTAGVYAARVSPAGNVIDTGGFAIYSDPVNGILQHQPAVGFDGSNFVVLWNRIQPDNLHANLYAMRVATSGQLIDGTATSGGFAVTTGPNNIVGNPTLTMLGGNVLAAWQGDCFAGSGIRICGARLTTPANINSPISVLGVPGFQFKSGGMYPRLAATAGGALLVWQTILADPVHTVSAMSIYPFGP
jgi:hypothetical protein